MKENGPRIVSARDTVGPSVAAEVERLYGLENRFLGRSLVSCCRLARALHSRQLRRVPGNRDVYPVFLVWDVVPEIAARLGETVFMPGERETAIKGAGTRALREWAWNCIRHSPAFSADGRLVAGAFNPWDLIRNDVANGNPVFIALDRLHPVGPEDIATDMAAAHLCRTSLQRGMPSPSAMWTPDMQKPR